MEILENEEESSLSYPCTQEDWINEKSNSPRCTEQHIGFGEYFQKK